MEKEMTLSLNGELELVKAIQNGNEEAINRLKQTRLRFVEAVAKQYQNRGLTLEELVEEGNKGLITAARQFDGQRGLKFPSYAVWWIRNNIRWAVQQKTIEAMNETENLVYREFFANSEIPGVFEKTKWHGKPSDNSFLFVIGECDKCETLSDIFDVRDQSLFKKKYNQAINKNCKNKNCTDKKQISEEGNINRLHSSSLAALLFFYGIDEQHQIKLELQTDGEKHEYTFYDSYFEVKTIVFKNHRPSNMDVVLEGHDENGLSVLLFLESKFSEYLNGGNKSDISMKYWNMYQQLGLFDGSMDEIIASGSTSIELKGTENVHYCEGIKQMISHYMGVSNYAEHGDEALVENSQIKGKHPDVILLGEILFKFDEKVDPKGKYGIYAEDYRKLARTINEKNQLKKLRVLKDVLCYQEIENKALDLRVKRFYQYQ